MPILSEELTSTVLSPFEMATSYNDIYNANIQPYIGELLFPPEKTMDIVATITQKKAILPKLLHLSSPDSTAPLIGRITIPAAIQEIPMFRDSKVITEKDLLVLANYNDSASPFIKQALTNVYNDFNSLVDDARATFEILRMQLMSGVAINIQGTPAGSNMSFVANYDLDGSYATNNMGAPAVKWSDYANSTPVTDINNTLEAMSLKTNRTPSKLMMSLHTYKELMSSKQVNDLVYFWNNQPLVIATKKKQALSDYLGVDIYVNTTTYEDNYGKATPMFPDGVVTFYPDGVLGTTLFGITPEEISTGVNAATVAGGAAVYSYDSPNPVNRTTVITTRPLPMYEQMLNTFILSVD